MVNTGKPSLDCLPCRRRKLKCDLRRDTCGQCRRARISCFGYRDPKDLVFRDETRSIHQRAQTLSSAEPLHPEVLPLAWDVQARQAFFTHYVFGLSRTHDVLPSLYFAAPTNGHLASSVDAVGLAFLAFYFQKPADPTAVSISVLARERYLSAVRGINRALVSPDNAVADETLQSALLLDLYEKMVNRFPSEVEPWMAHVKGGLALLNARGEERNFATHTARRLAIRLTITLITSCAASEQRAPPTLRRLYKSLDPYFAANDIKWNLTALVVRLMDFQADIKEAKLTSDYDILQVALDLEEAFAAKAKQLRHSWKPLSTVVDTNNPYVYEGRFHIHEDHFVVQSANVFRIMRLILHSSIQHYARRMEASVGTRILQESRQIIESDAAEMCTTPQQFILLGAKPGNEVPFTPLQVAISYTLLSPLYVAGSTSTNPRLRAWVINLMRHIAEQGRLEMAEKVARILETRPTETYWAVYRMLGSYAFAA